MELNRKHALPNVIWHADALALLVLARRAHDAITTSLLRQNDVAISFDVIMTLLLRYYPLAVLMEA